MMADHSANRETTLAQQATDWFSRRRSGDMDAAEVLQFDEWIGRSVDNRSAYETVVRAWTLTAGLRENPKILAMREIALQRRSARHVWRSRGVAAALALSLLVVGMAALMRWPLVKAELRRSTFASNVGQRSTVVLPDGSRLTLDTDSIVVAQETQNERRMDLLRGRAFFDVAKEHHRPFVVYAGADSVTATGTAFDVRLEPKGMEVNLLRGTVSIERPAIADAPPLSTRLVAGQKLDARSNAGWRIAPIAPSEGARWLSGQVAFDHTPLSEVVGELNRYSNRKLRLADARVGQTPIVGVFDTSDLEGSVQMIADERLAKIVARGQNNIVLGDPER